MRLGRELSRWARQSAIPCVCALTLAYFGYHAVEGERGLLSWIQKSEAVEEARAELASLKAEREAFERKVARLRPDGLDADLLDEQSRFMLNLGRSDEVLIYDAPVAR